MKKLFVLVTALFVSQQYAFAGSAQAHLECSSASGKTQVSATFPGDSSESGVIFTIEGQQLAYMDENMKEIRELNNNRIYEEYANAQVVNIRTVDQLKKRKFAMTVDWNSELFRMDAIPNTVKYTKTYGGSRATFKAQVQGIDPRNFQKSKVIEVSCKYRYEI